MTIVIAGVALLVAPLAAGASVLLQKRLRARAGASTLALVLGCMGCLLGTFGPTLAVVGADGQGDGLAALSSVLWGLALVGLAGPPCLLLALALVSRARRPAPTPRTAPGGGLGLLCASLGAMVGVSRIQGYLSATIDWVAERGRTPGISRPVLSADDFVLMALAAVCVTLGTVAVAVRMSAPDVTVPRWLWIVGSVTLASATVMAVVVGASL
ncbi:MAG: hypothetical protein OHK0013_26830 [Sandaracinaceae bacterium]